mmetsp:Transcript_21006/g.26572  ORF Transcript_21006/g.26572 Transcript_21006/m.26572 type:complete len:256 (+) Transcript_21006:1710-2477(+)
MVQVRECMQTLNQLMLVHTPKVVAVLEEHGIPSISYVPQFFMTGFLYNFPFDMVVRIWDSFWLRRFDFFYAVAVGVFKITQSITVKFEMEQMMEFLKFRDGPRELDFTIEQLIAGSIHMFNKMKPSQIRLWENEARETIEGAKRQTNPNLTLNTSQARPSDSGHRSPRKFVKKFSSSLTHQSTELQDISIHKPHMRKTRKNRRKKATMHDRTYSLPQNAVPPPLEELESEETAGEGNRVRKKKKQKKAKQKPTGE